MTTPADGSLSQAVPTLARAVTVATPSAYNLSNGVSNPVIVQDAI